MRSKQYNLTAKRVRYLFQYVPETGEIFWRNCEYSAKYNGRPAGSFHGRGRGYLYLHIDGHSHVASPVIWLYMTGKWPKETIDHKDRNVRNNKWNNLREATYSQNGANRRSTGILPRGVHRVRRQFRAQIHIKRKRIRLGIFKTAEEAGRAYLEAEKRLFGEFAGGDK